MHSRHENKQRKKRLCIYVDEFFKKELLIIVTGYISCASTLTVEVQKVIPDFYCENTIYFMNWSICFIKWQTKTIFQRPSPLSEGRW